jgi:membrane protein DedA with SNARE-associated domain
MTFLSLGYGLGEEWAHTSERLHRLLMFATGVAIINLVIAFAIKKTRSRR